MCVYDILQHQDGQTPSSWTTPQAQLEARMRHQGHEVTMRYGQSPFSSFQNRKTQLALGCESRPPTDFETERRSIYIADQLRMHRDSRPPILYTIYTAWPVHGPACNETCIPNCPERPNPIPTHSL